MKKNVRRLVVVAVVGLSVLTLVHLFDLSEAADTITRADPIWFAAAVIFYYITFPIRTFRWRILLDSVEIQADSRSANYIIILNFYLNMLVPAKLGDVYRAKAAKDRYDTSVSTALGTVVVERVLDLGILALGLVVTIPVVLGTRMAFSRRIIKWGFASIAILGFVCVVIVFSVKAPLPSTIRSAISRFQTGFTTISASSPVKQGAVLFSSISIWSLNIARLWAVTAAIGVSLEPLDLILIGLLIAFLSGLPYVPAGIGIVEVIGLSVLVTLGLTGNEAIAIILLDRIISVVLLVIPGTFLYIYTMFKN